MTIRSIVVAAALATGAAAPAEALTINFSPIAGDTLSASQAQAFELAAMAWSAIVKNDVSVSVQIGFTPLGDRVLGQTSTASWSAPAATVVAALRSSAATALDARVVLPAQTTYRIDFSSAQGKALGLIDPRATAPDGTIEFSSQFAFSDRRDAAGEIAAGTYDLIGIAEHEIGHLLGFLSNADSNGADETVLDLFRYDATDRSSLASGVPAYFSLDGGRTRLAAFADGVSNQASHWLGNTYSDGIPALMDPEVGTSSVRTITSLDLAALDAIGWNASAVQVSAVPLPGAAPLFGAGLILVAVTGGLVRGRKATA